MFGAQGSVTSYFIDLKVLFYSLGGELGAGEGRPWGASQAAVPCELGVWRLG